MLFSCHTTFGQACFLCIRAATINWWKINRQLFWSLIISVIFQIKKVKRMASLASKIWGLLVFLPCLIVNEESVFLGGLLFGQKKKFEEVKVGFEKLRWVFSQRAEQCVDVVSYCDMRQDKEQILDIVTLWYGVSFVFSWLKRLRYSKVMWFSELTRLFLLFSYWSFIHLSTLQMIICQKMSSG